ncbi:polysaccharide biosynthesis tyrosine autokinase [Rhodovulum adriaticum]|uniref:Tyrosine-protein kinase Etk/Wzc n=1 Tax=Rhodovulum adriaticum TaxID=35804 RepID=A0A4R2NZW4_RHOAD|nr:polysaccharide biosynthesis tyrosine autokinase [Rhodovulum adriaticum]MBK1634123.1 hypothetical protein [Rhodovulum adriaticum]TCP27328.1 tyrosine-protein kinase Etk/Wzc [Rhodovulum adriaticum]
MTNTPNPTIPDEDDGNEFHLADLGTQILARKWLVASCALVGLALGTLSGQLPPDKYSASALVHIERRSQGIELPEILVGERFGNLSLAQITTETHIIRSSFTLGPVADELNLDWRLEPQRFPVIGHMVVRRSWPQVPNWILPGYTRHGDAYELDLLEVDDHLINRRARIVVTGEGAFSANLPKREPVSGRVGEIVELAPGFRFRLSQLDVPPGREFTLWRSNKLQAVAAARSGLSVRERPPRNSGIADFSYQGTDSDLTIMIVNGVVRSYQRQTLNRRAAEIDRSIAFIETQLPEVRAQTAAAAAELADFRQENDVSDLTVGSQQLLQRIVGIEADLEELRFREEDLAKRLTPNHPEYRTLLDRKARLEERLEELRAESAELPPIEQQLLALQQKLERSIEIERQLSSRAEQLNIVRASAVSNINLLEPAVRSRRIGPDRRTPIVAGLLGGLFLGVLAVLGLNFMRRGIDDSRSIEELGLPLFATVNRVEGLRTDDTNTALYSLARTQPNDIVVESLRGLRTGLQFSLATAPNKSLMITSPAPSLGKSFISLNLSIVSAQAGNRVLLIDADLRKGKLRKQFGLPRRHAGLSDLLSGRAGIEEVLVTDPETGMDFIPTGSYPPNPADLLTAPQFKKLMEEATGYYDLVVVDCPPVLAVTDPGIIGQATGMSLLVIKHLETTKAEIQSSRKILANSGVTLSGAILTQFDASASRYGHYGHKYGYYGGYKYHYN